MRIDKEYQAALDRLYSLKNGVKNIYPYVEKEKSQKFQQDKGVIKLVNKDKEIIQELIDKSKWVPIKEGLPIDEQRVLAHLSNGWDSVCFYDGDKWILCCDDYIEVETEPFRKVVGWIELPMWGG